MAMTVAVCSNVHLMLHRRSIALHFFLSSANIILITSEVPCVSGRHDDSRPSRVLLGIIYIYRERERDIYIYTHYYKDLFLLACY